jgi:hypothetical protein
MERWVGGEGVFLRRGRWVGAKGVFLRRGRWVERTVVSLMLL